MIKQEHRFKSVHGTSKTSHVASVPTSLGKKGCFLRPAVFNNEESKEAPFLISLPFLLHCRSVLYLDQERGLRILFRRFGFGVDCHLGPSGALRVPLGQFHGDQLRVLQSAQQEMRSGSSQEFEVFRTCQLDGSDHSGPTKQRTSPPCGNEEISHRGEASPRLGQDHPEASLHHHAPQRDPHQEVLRTYTCPGGDRGGRHGEPHQQPGRTLESCGARGREGIRVSSGRSTTLEQSPRLCKIRRPLLASGPCPSTDRACSSVRPSREVYRLDDQETGKQLPEDILAMPQTSTGTMRCLHVDRGSAILGGQSPGNLGSQPRTSRSCDAGESGNGATIEVHNNEVSVNSGHIADDSRGSTSQDAAGSQESTGRPDVPASSDYNLGEQLLREEGHLQGLPQSPPEDPAEGLRWGEDSKRSQSADWQQEHEHQQEEERRDGSGRLPGVSRLSEVEEGDGESQKEAVKQKSQVDFSAAREEVEQISKRQRKALKQIQKKGKAALQCLEDSIQEIMSLLSTEDSETSAAAKVQATSKKGNLKVLSNIAQRNPHNVRKVAEVYNPGRFQPHVRKHQLLPGAAFDLELGDDLLQPHVQDHVKNYLKTVKPGLCVVSPPCVMFSLMQNMSNQLRLQDPDKARAHYRELLKAKRLFKFALEVAQIVRDYGGTFLLEHPLTSRAWQEQMIQKFVMEPDIFMTKGDQCAFGLQDSTGGFMKKRTGWITNNVHIHKMLSRDCDGTHEHVHVLGQSNGVNRSRQAQRYPQPLINAILQAYQKSLEETTEIHWVDMNQMAVDLDRELRLHRLLRDEDPQEIMAVNECLREVLNNMEDEDEENRGEDQVPDPLPELPEGDAPENRELHEDPAQPPGQPAGDDPGHQEPPEERHHAGRPLPRERPFTTEQLVRRAHEGLGHPGNEKLARILKSAGANDQAIQIAKNIQCSVCQRHQQVRPPRAAAPPKELPVNHTVGVDTVWLPTHRGKQRMALNVVCWSSRFQMITPLANHTPAEARRAYLQWVKFFGPPQRLYTDLGKEFLSAFQEGAELDSTYIEPGALEMPTQRSITERAGKNFKRIFEKAMESHVCQDESEWRELVDITSMTCNRLLNKSGFSPIQRVLGYSPKVPGSELLGGHHDQAVREWAYMGDAQIQRSQSMRLAAAKAFHEADCKQAIQNSLHAGRRSIDEFEAGNTVYFWRKATGGKIAKNTARHWKGPAKVVLTSPPSAIWVTYRGHIVKAAPEHLRMASSEEHSSLSSWMDDISNLRHQLEQEPRTGYIDLNKENDGETPEVNLDDSDQEDKIQPKFKLTGKTPQRQVAQREREDYWQVVEPGLLRRVHVEARRSSFSPTDDGQCPVPIRQMDDWRRTSRRFVKTGLTEEEVDDWRNSCPTVETEDWKGHTDFRFFEESSSSSLTRRPTMEASHEEEEPGDRGEVLQDRKHPRDESETEEEQPEKKIKMETEPPEEEEEPRGQLRDREEREGEEEPRGKRSRIEWNEIFYQGALTALAMKQKKEIKYKDLLGEVKEKFNKAISKEITNNLKTGAYEVLSPEESEAVRRQPDANILQSRYVFVEKMIDAEEIEDARAEGILIKDEQNLGYKAKARHVMKGFSEPDSEWLEAATPQVSPETVMLILQILSSVGWTPGYLDFTKPSTPEMPSSGHYTLNYHQKASRVYFNDNF